MNNYRFFILDDENHILGHKDHECDDDLAALDTAKVLSGEHPIELWAGERLVAHVNWRDADHTQSQAQSG